MAPFAHLVTLVSQHQEINDHPCKALDHMLEFKAAYSEVCVCVFRDGTLFTLA